MANSSSNPQSFPNNGGESELFHFPTAVVMLLDYDDKQSVRLLKLGHFYVRQVVQTTTSTPLMISYCSVDGFMWGMAKDAPIIRMTEKSFIFGFPGLLYTLQFPPICNDSQLLSLEKLFIKFGRYINFSDTASGGPGYYPCGDNEPRIWNIVRPFAEAFAHEVLVLYGHKPGRLVNMSPHQMISCYTRATRMSSVTETIANTIALGNLRQDHIMVVGNDGGESLDVMPTASSISVFTSIVDAIEAAWMHSMGVPLDLLDLNLNDYDPGFRVWKLSDMGVMTFAQGSDSTPEFEEKIVNVKSVISKSGHDDKEKKSSLEEVAGSSSNAAVVYRRGETKP